MTASEIGKSLMGDEVSKSLESKEREKLVAWISLLGSAIGLALKPVFKQGKEHSVTSENRSQSLHEPTDNLSLGDFSFNPLGSSVGEILGDHFKRTHSRALIKG